MIFPDYHLHSFFSSDSDADVHKIINSAKTKGLTSICVTDHYDMDFPIWPDEPDITFDLDTDAYYAYMSRIRDAAAPGFDFRIGVELGVTPDITDKLHDYVTAHPELDFIIASSHLVDNQDPYRPEYFEGKTDYQAYYRYFESILECVRTFRDFNVYGHLDYIMRYGSTKAAHFDINDYCDIFREIFEILVPEGKGIEINTGSLYRGLDFPHPHRDILKLYRQSGGEIVTVGSDAHKPEYVGYGFDIARELLLESGFRYYCTFSAQKPEFHKIV